MVCLHAQLFGWISCLSWAEHASSMLNRDSTQATIINKSFERYATGAFSHCNKLQRQCALTTKSTFVRWRSSFLSLTWVCVCVFECKLVDNDDHKKQQHQQTNLLVNQRALAAEIAIAISQTRVCILTTQGNLDLYAILPTTCMMINDCGNHTQTDPLWLCKTAAIATLWAFPIRLY